MQRTLRTQSYGQQTMEKVQSQEFVHTTLGRGNAVRDEFVGRGHTQWSGAGVGAEVVSGLGTKLWSGALHLKLVPDLLITQDHWPHWGLTVSALQRVKLDVKMPQGKNLWQDQRPRLYLMLWCCDKGKEDLLWLTAGGFNSSWWRRCGIRREVAGHMALTVRREMDARAQLPPLCSVQVPKWWPCSGQF